MHVVSTFFLMVVMTIIPQMAQSQTNANCAMVSTEAACRADTQCDPFVGNLEHCGCILPESNEDVVIVADFSENSGSWDLFMATLKQAVANVLGAGSNNRVAMFVSRNSGYTTFEQVYDFTQTVAGFQSLTVPYVTFVGGSNFECDAIDAGISYLDAQGGAGKRHQLSILVYNNDQNPCNIQSPPASMNIMGVYDSQMFSPVANPPVITLLNYVGGPGLTPIDPLIDHYTIAATTSLHGRSAAAFSEHWCEAIPAAAPVTSSPISSVTPSPVTGSPSQSAPTSSPVTGSPATGSPSQSTPTSSPVTGSPVQTSPTTSPVTGSPSQSSPTSSPVTGSPTPNAAAPLTSSPATGSPSQSAPTSSPVTGSPAQSAPTSSPVTGSPVQSAPTSSPVTGSPVQTSPTASPVTGSPLQSAPTSSPITSSPSQPAQVFGDPHYITVDGLRYDFHGLCSYTLIEDLQTNDFEIISTNTPCELKSCVDKLRVVFRVPKNSKVHYHDPAHAFFNVSHKHFDSLLKNHDTKVDKVIIRMELGPKIWVNDVQVDIPKKNSDIHYDGFDFVISDVESEEGLMITLVTDVGLRVEWNGKSYSSVSVDSKYENKVGGLMGTLSNNLRDDLLLRNGTRLVINDNDLINGNKLINENKVHTFAMSWMKKQSTDPNDCKTEVEDDLQEKICHNEEIKSNYKKACTYHLKGLKMYNECIDYGMDAKEWDEYCYRDLCSCLDDNMFFCMKYAGINFEEACHKYRTKNNNKLQSAVAQTQGFVHN